MGANKLHHVAGHYPGPMRDGAVVDVRPAGDRFSDFR